MGNTYISIKNDVLNQEQTRKLIILLNGIAKKKSGQEKILKIDIVYNSYVITYMADSPITDFKRDVFNKYMNAYVKEFDLEHAQSLNSIFYILTKDNFTLFINSLKDYANE